MLYRTKRNTRCNVLDVVRIVLAEGFQNANLGLGRFLVLVDGSTIMSAKVSDRASVL